MFIGILLLIVAFVTYLYVHDWFYVSRFTPKKIQKVLNQISYHISLNEWEEADRLLKFLAEYRKSNKNISLFEIQVLQGTNQLEAGLKKVQQAAQEFPEELLFRLEEAKILLKLGLAKESLEAFHLCASILRQESDLALFASAYLQNGHPDKCLEILNPFLNVSQSELVKTLAADAYCDLKQFKEAIDHYSDCIKMGFNTYPVFKGIATAYRRIGNLGEAEKIFRKLLEQNPQDPALILGLGACFQERGHFQKALLIYQSSEVWESKNPQILKEAAICAIHSKKYSYAEKYLFELIQLEKPALQMLTYYGYTLECQKKWQEAEQVYLRIVQLFPSSYQGFLALSWLFGVGLSTTLTPKQGVNFAHVALNLKNELVTWEILSAVEARVGNFERAYQIQQSLAMYDEDKDSKQRRQSALRSLRKQIPLGDIHVVKTQVA